ncbi:hypothetical protein HPB52_007994 [Rhipicephalus sanguineus]|uniref:Uncharacterized protein n=1 Tax=Rhipicephalus sanguineus TaxID=34632 RepID=A0A9D4Q7V2_RHISA|nr:hypothetical protein HPB52_007994 [Rhipicephalus sanguineus]
MAASCYPKAVGCTPQLALRLSHGAVTAVPTYALPLVQLTPCPRDQVELQHCKAIRHTRAIDRWLLRWLRPPVSTEHLGICPPSKTAKTACFTRGVDLRALRGDGISATLLVEPLRPLQQPLDGKLKLDKLSKRADTGA